MSRRKGTAGERCRHAVKESSVRRLVTLIVFSVVWPGAAGAAQGQKSPCALLTAAELEAALGGKAGPLSDEQGARICSGPVGKRKVMIRVAERGSGDTGEAERKGIEMVRQMGGQVDVQTEGELTCSMMIPPATAPEMGHNTTCTILRAGVVVGVEVTATSRQDMATTQTVKELVQKARSRM